MAMNQPTTAARRPKITAVVRPHPPTSKAMKAPPPTSGTSSRARWSTVASVWSRSASSASRWGVIRADRAARSASGSATTTPRGAFPVIFTAASAWPPMRAQSDVKEKSE
jgi:hypothetical protein